MTLKQNLVYDPAEDEHYMQAALREAEEAAQEDEIPVGAVVVHRGKIIARGHNQREKLLDPTAHAEMLALTAASAYQRSWRLVDCTVYVTLEPCPMCAGAMLQARIARLVYGARDPKAGACGSLYDLHDDARLNHCMSVTSGTLVDQCSERLVSFFAELRNQADT